MAVSIGEVAAQISVSVDEEEKAIAAGSGALTHMEEGASMMAAATRALSEALGFMESAMQHLGDASSQYKGGAEQADKATGILKSALEGYQMTPGAGDAEAAYDRNEKALTDLSSETQAFKERVETVRALAMAAFQEAEPLSEELLAAKLEADSEQGRMPDATWKAIQVSGALIATPPNIAI